MNDSGGPQHRDDGVPTIQPRRLRPGGRAVERINEELNKDGPKAFLPEAENILASVVEDFTGSLGIEAIKRARRRKGTAVDRRDVTEARRALRDPLMQAWMIGIMSLLAGSAVTATVGILLLPDPPPHVGRWWMVVAVLIAGAAVLAFLTYPWHHDE